MAEIRLVNVSKTYHPRDLKMFSAARGTRFAMRGYADQSFVERAAAAEVASERPEGDVRALDGVNLTIRDGETMAIVGPSCCGKSTLLRMVAGLEEPDEGDVYYDDRRMNDVHPKDRGVGMVFQSYALYPHMPGEGNLGFFFKVRKRPPEEMMERIRITSEIMGLGFDVLLPRKPPTLSGGQQQRVAIARCIVRDPSLFLFDEPLSNLDAKLRSATRVEIKRLLRRFAITAIYVTHDQTEAITLGDRIAVMRAGRVEQLGAYDEIISDPVNAFVAGFLGLPPMNLLRGWTVSADGRRIEGPLGSLALPPAVAAQVRPGQGLILGFRSSAAQLTLEGEAAPAQGLQLAAQVLNCEPDFARHIQTANLQAGEMLFGVQAPLEMRLATGYRVTVTAPEESAYWFDAETEKRVRG